MVTLKSGALVASSSFAELSPPFFFVFLIFLSLYILPGMESEIFSRLNVAQCASVY